MITVSIPATTANLGPGFDCLGLALSLYNTVEMAPAATWHIEISGEGADSLSRSYDNLVWQAAICLWKKAGVVPPIVKITLHNQIPLARGLGSSSAAIVGGLVAANSFLASPLPLEHLLDIATEIEGHPDNVAPALYGGLAASACEGGTVYSRPLALCPSLRFVVCVPEFSLPTALARQALPQDVPHKDAVFNVSRTVLLVQALQQGDAQLLRFASADKLHQPYRQSLIRGYSDVRSHALAAGAAAVMISGAGPTMLAITQSSDTSSMCNAMEQGFASQGITSRAIELTPCKKGAHSVPVRVRGNKRN